MNDTKPPEQRYRKYQLHQRYAREFFGERRPSLEGPMQVVFSMPVLNGMPPDARIVHCYFNIESLAIEIIAEHPSFDPVPFGNRIPGGAAEIQMLTMHVKLDDLQAAMLKDLLPAESPKAAERPAWEFLGPPPK